MPDQPPSPVSSTLEEVAIRKPQFLEGYMTKLGVLLAVLGLCGINVPEAEAREIETFLTAHREELSLVAGLLIAIYGKIRRKWRHDTLGTILSPVAGDTQAAARDGVMRAVAISLLALMPVGCVVYKDGPRYYGAVGTDAEAVEVNAQGMTMLGMNNSAAFKETAKLVNKMWNSYLTLSGLKFVTGQYYNHQGKLVNQGTTLELEKLRNARSLQEAESQLKLLQAFPPETATAVAPALLP
jgi:hypothetical protein